MVIDFSTLDLLAHPVLILRTLGGEPLAVLQNAMHIEPGLMYNEISELDFEIVSEVDGVPTPMYDEIVGYRIVELQGVGWFLLQEPSETNNGVYRKKSCKAYSVEYEFTRKQITLPNGTYKFYDWVNPENTILGILLEDMPDWRIGSIPPLVMNRYRTFEVNGENRYNFIKNKLQSTYGCIVNFDIRTDTIYIDDASVTPDETPVYLSADNLAKEIKVQEHTKDIKTSLDVNGAEGVSIRDVNPNGTNRLIDLDYYMTPVNFSQGLIDRYYAWKQLNEDNRRTFYNLSIRHTTTLELKTSREAKLTDLQGELSSLDNIRAVTIQAIASGMQTQSDLDRVNADMQRKRAEIADQEALIAQAAAEAEQVFEQMQSIRNVCSYDSYFTEAEKIQMNRYIIEDSISNSSFVAATTTYAAEAKSANVGAISIQLTGSVITATVPVTGGSIYDIRGGHIQLGHQIEADVIAATVDCQAGNEFVASYYLSDVIYTGEKYPQACVTITGTRNAMHVNADLSAMDFTTAKADLYFTLDVSEYEKRSIAWELYEYGLETIRKLSKPSYTFSVESANFLTHADFTEFKNVLRLGKRIYLELTPGHILTPICIGVRYQYEQPESLELIFSDKYTAGDSGNSLVDLLGQSVTMGKTLDVNQYIYSEWNNSGANTTIAKFMTSALDVAKNNLFSSTGNAITWDGSGLRMRKWLDASQTVYDPEEMWMVNNNILLTANGWQTAQMAIGKFHDDNLGDCWGVVAPAIVGTLLAGNKLVIESEKKDGGIAVFRVDEDGAKLYNSNFLLANGNRSILLHPEVGLVVGPIPSYYIDDDGKYHVDTDKANFYADEEGNVFLRGSITATELHVGNQTIEEFVGSYVVDNGGGSTVNHYQPEPPTNFTVGDLWRDSDSPYHYLYTAVSKTGNPAVDWVLISARVIEGAAINTNADAGTIDIVAGSTMNLSSGGSLSITGIGSVNLASEGGINLLSGQVKLGSAANVITSAGVLSLASGNIELNGPTNTVTVGRNGGTVNIGTDGTGLINLATYQVKSSTTPVSYSTYYSTGGKSTSTNSVSTFTYTATDDDGAQSSTTFTITTAYSKASVTRNDPPYILNGRLLQIVYQNRGINVYADAQNDTMILAPSVSNGNLMNWKLVSAETVAATNISASTIVADSMYLPGTDGDIIAVADQKWTIDKVVEILNNNEVIPSLKKGIDNAKYLARNHTHAFTVSDSGTVTLGKATTGSSTNFNMADTVWYKNRVSAFVQAVRSGLSAGSWGGTGSPAIPYRLTTNASSRTVKLTPINAVANFVFPGDTGATQISVGLPELDLSQDLSSYSTERYNLGKNSVTLSSANGWQGGNYVVSATNGQSLTVPHPTITISGGTSFTNNQTVIYALSSGVANGFVAQKTIDVTSVYNAGWNACRDACTRTTSVYTISQTAPGYLYMKMSDGSFTGVGSDWVRVTSAVAYNRPAAKT